MTYLVEILGWLNLFSASAMTSAASTMRDLVNQKIQSHKFFSAYQIIERLKTYSNKSTITLEKVEIWAYCGLAYYQMGNLKEAIVSLKQALAECPNGSHSQAVIRWLLGTMQWGIATEHDSAINNWKRTVEELSLLELIADHDNKQDARAWYNDRKIELNTTLEAAISRNLSRI